MPKITFGTYWLQHGDAVITTLWYCQQSIVVNEAKNTNQTKEKSHTGLSFSLSTTERVFLPVHWYLRSVMYIELYNTVWYDIQYL